MSANAATCYHRFLELPPDRPGNLELVLVLQEQVLLPQSLRASFRETMDLMTRQLLPREVDGASAVAAVLTFDRASHAREPCAMCTC